MQDDWKDIEQIKTIKARYFRYMDSKSWPELAALFTDDALISFPDDGGQDYPTPGDFVDMAKTVMADVTSLHQGFMPEIELLGDGRATALWAMVDELDAPKGMPHSEGKPVRIRGAGHYHESYVKTDGGWKISRMLLKRTRLELS